MIINALALIIGYGNPMIGFQENDRKTNTENLRLMLGRRSKKVKTIILHFRWWSVNWAVGMKVG